MKMIPALYLIELPAHLTGQNFYQMEFQHFIGQIHYWHAQT